MTLFDGGEMHNEESQRLREARENILCKVCHKRSPMRFWRGRHYPNARLCPECFLAAMESLMDEADRHAEDDNETLG